MSIYNKNSGILSSSKETPDELYRLIKMKQKMLEKQMRTTMIQDDTGSFYEKEYSTHDWTFEKKQNDTVSRSSYDQLHKNKKQIEAKLSSMEEAMGALTEGNETAQRMFIQAKPSNIQYIKRPYVNIQVEAITADPSCFDLISNPAQEAIDTYRMIR